MQRVLFQQAEDTQLRSQAIRVLPGHGTGIDGEAINDDVYHGETSMLRLVFSVLGNVFVGALLLSTMFLLPHIVAGILS